MVKLDLIEAVCSSLDAHTSAVDCASRIETDPAEADGDIIPCIGNVMDILSICSPLANAF